MLHRVAPAQSRASIDLGQQAEYVAVTRLDRPEIAPVEGADDRGVQPSASAMTLEGFQDGRSVWAIERPVARAE